MKIVENKKASPKAIEKKLQGLLYRKNLLEHQIKVAQTGANISCEYVKSLEERVKDIVDSTLPDHQYQMDYFKLRYDLLEAKKEAADYISDFKEYKGQYDEGVKEDLKKLLGEEKFADHEFQDIEAKAKDLVQYEIYGSTEYKAENIEHPQVIKRIKEYIDILENLIIAIRQELKENTSLTRLEKIRLEKDLFDYSNHGTTLQKRLNDRTEYYENQFLPMFRKDMEECEKNLDRYIGIAEKLVADNVDPMLTGAIGDFKANKLKDEELWLYYTALRNRLKSIGLHLGRNRKKYPKALDYMQEFLS